MALAHPHTGIHAFAVQSVPIGFPLAVQHQLVQIVGHQKLVPAAVKDGGLKQIAGIDVHDALCGFPQIALQQGQFFLRRRLRKGVVAKMHLVKRGGGLRHGHRIVRVHGTIVLDLTVVEGVPELMSKGIHGAEGAVKVRHDAALFEFRETAIESASGFPAAGEEIDPGIVKRVAHHVSDIRRKSVEAGEQIITGIFRCKRPVGVAQGGKQFKPW